MRPVLTDYHLHLRPDEDETPPERYFTAENVDRYLAAADAAGMEELGVSEHVYRFTRRSTSGAIRSGCRTPTTISTPTASSSARPRCGSGWSATSFPAPRSAPPSLLAGRDFDYVVGSVHFLGERRRVDHDGWDVWESEARSPRRSGAATSHALRPSAPAPASSTSSPTPTWSRSGAAPAAARARSPLLL